MPEPGNAKTPDLRVSTPLAAVATPGTYGRAAGDGVGVIFRERRDFAIVSVVGHKDRRDLLAESLKGALTLDLPRPGESASNGEVTLIFAGLDRWNAVAEGIDGAVLLHRLRDALGDGAALADQSHGLCMIEMQGPRVLDVLAKGTAVDTHPDSFPIGCSLMTGMNHLAVHLWRPGEDRVMVTLLRSFARDLFEFLSTMSLEYGYRIDR